MDRIQTERLNQKEIDIQIKKELEKTEDNSSEDSIYYYDIDQLYYFIKSFNELGNVNRLNKTVIEEFNDENTTEKKSVMPFKNSIAISNSFTREYNDRYDNLLFKLDLISTRNFDSFEMVDIDLKRFSEINNKPMTNASEFLGIYIEDPDNHLNLSISCLQPFRDFDSLKSNEQLNSKIAELKERLQCMRFLGTKLIIVCLNCLDNDNCIKNDENVIKDLKLLSETVSDFDKDFKIAIEILSWSSYVQTLDHLLKIVNKVDRKNLGICFDSFHYLCEFKKNNTEGQFNLEILDQIIVDGRLFFVQLSDSLNIKFNYNNIENFLYYSRNFRVLPFQGDYSEELVSIIQKLLLYRLHENGIELSLECFNPYNINFNESIVSLNYLQLFTIDNVKRDDIKIDKVFVNQKLGQIQFFVENNQTMIDIVKKAFFLGYDIIETIEELNLKFIYNDGKRHKRLVEDGDGKKTFEVCIDKFYSLKLLLFTVFNMEVIRKNNGCYEMGYGSDVKIELKIQDYGLTVSSCFSQTSEVDLKMKIENRNEIENEN
ncbi:uncharacterized protein ASCRUDRAFT_146111 [Ascoidea rubescens DSM 1968]|uniref:Xylose isomerase-like TIM barrel domain-containing protein n=1 Tax=Ascoidea rubescens DSM 1968 TaxID=1344418 RepID=A0A1D2VHY2_9ASCO|nr:hypothetical protein ASCRUDRAFT_146111 [Ascoidea rubescens DSM 1968]ODV61087.1 hypothetical protein ASCRUDRAFT_146111 [Ascoidea rubescens DSM 1968]